MGSNLSRTSHGSRPPTRPEVLCEGERLSTLKVSSEDLGSPLYGLSKPED